MHIVSVIKYLLGVTVLLILAEPSEADIIHLLFGPIIDKFFKTGHDIIKAISHVAFGGGTAVVADAITLNYFEIGPTLIKALITHVIPALFQGLLTGGGLIISAIGYIISTIIWIIAEIIIWIVKGLWDLKFEIIKRAIAVVVPVVAAGEVNVNVDLSGRNNTSVDRILTVLRGRREVKGLDFSHLESTFTSAALNDRMECLPMVFCAIYADPDDLVSPVESKFKKAFSSFFSEGYTPMWAAKYVKATLVGETSKSNARCQAEYPKCTYSPRNLRRLITQTANAYFYKMNHKKVKS